MFVVNFVWREGQPWLVKGVFEHVMKRAMYFKNTSVQGQKAKMKSPWSHVFIIVYHYLMYPSGNLAPFKAMLKMMFPFPWWDMIFPWRVQLYHSKSREGHGFQCLSFHHTCLTSKATNSNLWQPTETCFCRCKFQL